MRVQMAVAWLVAGPLLITPALASAGTSPDAASEGAPRRWINNLDALGPDQAWLTSFAPGETVVRHFDGDRWTGMDAPHLLGRSVAALSVASPESIWLVGRETDHPYNDNFGLHWDGEEWHNTALPLGSLELARDVVAMPDGTAIAVGCSFERSAPCYPVALSWDGSQWSKLTSPDVGSSAVAAVAADDAWSVGPLWSGSGEMLRTVLSHFDGERWTPADLPMRASRIHLGDVTMLASDDVWAVGYRDSRRAGVVLHWDGETWSKVPGRALRGDLRLGLVSASGPDDVWATVSSLGEPRVVHYDGKRWRDVPLDGAPADFDLMAIAAAAPHLVWISGSADSSSTRVLGRWDGSSWDFST